MPEVIVGVDPGLTNTAVVVLDRTYQVQSLNLIQARSVAGKRLVDIEMGVDSVLSKFSSSDISVYLEGYAYGAKYQRESLAELGGVLRRYFYLNQFEYWVIPPLLLKKYVSGSTRANKNFMKKRTKEKWGHSFKSDDICDAYGLARLGVTCHYSLPFSDDHEREVVREIQNYPGNYLEANTARRPPKRHVNRQNTIKS